MYCIVLYCIVLYCIVLYCIVLYYIILYYIILYYIILYYIICVRVRVRVRLRVRLCNTFYLCSAGVNSIALRHFTGMNKLLVKIIMIIPQCAKNNVYDIY